MVAESRAAARLLELVRRVAPSRATVLIQGESGTGKELVARLLHFWSDRVGQPFVAVNCKAFAEGVLESELFGHEKGAFTGAVAARAGCFERATSGTLFLDEIGEVPPRLPGEAAARAAGGEVLRVGGAQPRPRRRPRRRGDQPRPRGRGRGAAASARICSSASTSSRSSSPPLRERREDVLPLAEHFLARFADREPPVSGFSPEARRALVAHALARQRARAGERHRAGRRAVPRRAHRGEPLPVRRAAGAADHSLAVVEARTSARCSPRARTTSPRRRATSTSTASPSTTR